MKITLHHFDGTSETFTDCSFNGHCPPELGFTGLDWRRVRVSMRTTLPYTIVEETPLDTAKEAAKTLRESVYRQ